MMGALSSDQTPGLATDAPAESVTGEKHDVILEARSVKRHFKVGGGLLAKATTVRAVDGVSLNVKRGETFAIVGESGCGKSTLARVLMHLLTPTQGTVHFEGEDITALSGSALADLRRHMQFIFQDPFSSLNPRMTVGRIIGEPIETHEPEVSAAERQDRVAALLDRVGLRPEHAGRYPHEFSGGQRQRIGIARALASGPKLIIGDEPVSALDVSVQAQVVNLLEDLKAEFDLTLVIIAHDLAVIRHMSDRVAVMYLGEIVEMGPADEVFAQARHPYTLALLSAIPEPRYGHARERIALSGETPSPSNPPNGCRFHTRCPFARENCKTQAPALRAVAGDHVVACHHWEEILEESGGFAPAPPSPHRDNAEARFALYRNAVWRNQPAQSQPASEAGNTEVTRKDAS